MGWKAKCPGRAPLPVATSPAPALTCWGRHPQPRAVFNCHYKLNCVMQQLVKCEYNSGILSSSFYFSLPPPPSRSMGLFPAVVSKLLLSNLSTMERPALPLGNHLPDKHVPLGGTFS